ncbi:MAG: hypothetical protein IJZ19_11780, partial [Lentisphaeria bacterium]|nr:hypothetical protein [Lentisphaeria bacterium]
PTTTEADVRPLRLYFRRHFKAATSVPPLDHVRVRPGAGYALRADFFYQSFEKSFTAASFLFGRRMKPERPPHQPFMQDETRATIAATIRAIQPHPASLSLMGVLRKLSNQAKKRNSFHMISPVVCFVYVPSHHYGKNHCRFP